jgi:4-alpha-glucanotransferase
LQQTEDWDELRKAEAYGIEPYYETIWGTRREIDPDTRRRLTAAIEQGLVSTSDGWCGDDAIVMPLKQPDVAVRVNWELFGGREQIRLRATLEDGQQMDLAVARADGRLRASFGSDCLDIPLGYHTLQLAESDSHSMAAQREVPWIVVPERCFGDPDMGQRLGLNCFLPSLRSAGNWGIGDFADLVKLAKAARQRAKFDFVGINPLHAIHNRAPYNTSPYLPLSIFARNFVYLHLGGIEEYCEGGVERILAGSARVQAELARLRALDLVDYAGVGRLKKLALWLCHRSYLRRHPEAKGLRDYQVAKGARLRLYATYCAFDDHFHRLDGTVWHWRQWPKDFQRPDSDASLRLAAQLRHRIDFYCYAQWKLDEQLAWAQRELVAMGLERGIYHDLALATDHAGADLWAYQDEFVAGVRVGSPPDDFNENGQDWGFPALHPRLHARKGFRQFGESVRMAAGGGGVLRLDHVMRLARLYWIPDGKSARDGGYVRDRFRELLGVLALESQRGEFLVVGEDLGTVPEYFRAALDEFGVLSYRLMIFEREGERFRKPVEYPRQALCAFTTHDLPTLDGWCTGEDLRLRREAGQLAEENLPGEAERRRWDLASLDTSLGLSGTPTSEERFGAIAGFLRSTPCRLVLVNLEELLGETRQQNLPGTTAEHPNWRRKARVSIEELETDATWAARTEALR